MVHQNTSDLDVPSEVDQIVNFWTPVDIQLSHLVGFSPDAPSTTPLPGASTAGITLDVTVTNLDAGPGKGISALMFPLLSSTQGFLRLV
jgi:hypothetical protein